MFDKKYYFSESATIISIMGNDNFRQKVIRPNVINNTIKIANCAWAHGYISRKPNADGSFGYFEPYVGRYGYGYKLHEPCWHSTIYHYVTYYVYSF